MAAPSSTAAMKERYGQRPGEEREAGKFPRAFVRVEVSEALFLLPTHAGSFASIAPLIGEIFPDVVQGLVDRSSFLLCRAFCLFERVFCSVKSVVVHSGEEED